MSSGHWSTIVDQWSLINDRWIAGQWSLIHDHSSFFNDHWSPITDHWSITYLCIFLKKLWDADMLQRLFANFEPFLKKTDFLRAIRSFRGAIIVPSTMTAPWTLDSNPVFVRNGSRLVHNLWSIFYTTYLNLNFFFQKKVHMVLNRDH